jgi:hypothetical protein
MRLTVFVTGLQKQRNKTGDKFFEYERIRDKLKTHQGSQMPGMLVKPSRP